MTTSSLANRKVNKHALKSQTLKECSTWKLWPWDKKMRFDRIEGAVYAQVYGFGWAMMDQGIIFQLNIKHSECFPCKITLWQNLYNALSIS